MADGNGNLSKFLIPLCFFLLGGMASLLTTAFREKPVTHDELKDAIANAPYPWVADRGVVMDHIDDSEIHEKDAAKRARIKEVVGDEIEPIKVELRHIASAHEALQRQLAKNQELLTEIRLQLANGGLPRDSQ